MARGGSRNARGEPPEEAEEPMAEEAVDPLQLAVELPPLPEVPEHAAAQQPNPANVPVPPGYDGPPVQAPQNPQNVIPNNNDWRYGDNFQGQLIDYSTKQGRAMRSHATKGLFEEDPDNLFDCNAEGLREFLIAVRERADNTGWNDPVHGVLHIPVAKLNNRPYHLCSHHGVIEVSDVKAAELTYISANIPSRKAQNTQTLYECLMKSLSSVGKVKMRKYENEYTVGGYSSGSMLLRLIIQVAGVDTTATRVATRLALNNLSTYIETV